MRFRRFIDIFTRERIEEPGTERLLVFMFTLTSPVHVRQPAGVGVYAGAFAVPHHAVVSALRPSGYRGRAMLRSPRS